VGFVGNITNEIILGLDKLGAYASSVNIGREKLHLAEEELSLCSPGAGPRTSRIVVAKEHLIPTQCKGIVIAKMKSPLK
jgi:hypothetical protein